MILSHTHKFIFLCNGKTGTSSIEATLAPYQEGEEFEMGVPGLYHEKHIPPAALRALLGPDIWEEYFTFCFVRNPWDWFVSQYFWNHKPRPISRKWFLRNPIDGVRTFLQNRSTQRRLREKTTFSKEDIRKTYDLLRKYRGVYQADSLFQHTYVFGPEDEQLVDFVCRFEHIADDFDEAMDRIGVDAHLPHRNPTTHRDYQSYYTPETAALVKELYQVDVDTFDYTFA